MCYMFFFNDTATTEIYTLSLHDALPIWSSGRIRRHVLARWTSRETRCVFPYDLDPRMEPCLMMTVTATGAPVNVRMRSEEHTSELQSRQYLVCRLLLEKNLILLLFKPVK